MLHREATDYFVDKASAADRLTVAYGLAILSVFIALTFAYCFTRAPWWDEGVFADVSINLARRGFLASRVLYSFGYRSFPHADEYTYWQFPLYLVSLGAWFRLVNPTIETMRVFSIIWGCVYLTSWLIFIFKLSRDIRLALFVTGIVAFDITVLSAASDGRMDMMCAALGFAGMAAFLWFRQANWERAVILSACFGAASFFCHPMGALMSVMIAAVILLNSTKFRWKAVLGAAAPYLAGSLIYAIYVSRAPLIFVSQTRSAAGYRISGATALIRNVLDDFHFRYLDYYLISLQGIFKLKVVLLVFALAGVVALASSSRLRSQPLGRTLLALSAIGYLGVALLDNQKLPVYFMFSLPFFGASGAVWAYYSWQNRGAWRIAATLICVPVLVGVGGFIYKICADDYANLYAPAIRAIKDHSNRSGIVMGGAELGFALGFNDHLIDDRYLGYYSGITPDIYVVNPYYGGQGSAWLFAQNKLRKRYHLAFANPMYSVYVRNADGV